MQDSKNKLSTITIWLHWIVGLTIIALLAVGVYMVETETIELYDIHKSIGILIFVVILLRVVWRVKNSWLEPADNYERVVQVLAKTSHWILIIGTVLMPVSGMLMSWGGGYTLGIFGIELVGINLNPDNPEEVLPRNGTLGGFGHEVHWIIGYIMIATLVLHIGGALKHHIIDKDGTLRRMFGAQID